MLNKIKSFFSLCKDKLNLRKIKPVVKEATVFSTKLAEKFRKIFEYIGKKLAKMGVSANLVSIIGFIIGISAINFLAMEMYFWALVCIIVNRIFDTLDGAVARHSKVTEFGIFLDAALDYIFYAGVIVGFALANPDNIISATFLLFAFSASATTMLSYAIIAYKNNTREKIELGQSPFYLGGWAQGFETLIALVILCILPALFVPIALVLGVLCLFKAFSIIASAYYTFVIANRPAKGASVNDASKAKSNKK